MERGRFVVIDGGEGAGKTSVIDELKKVLPADKFSFIREPGNTDIGEGVRTLLLDPDLKMGSLTELLLFWAARAENVATQIEPALASGVNVISDRFDSTTWAYQIRGRQREDLIPLFEEIQLACMGTLAPDLYIYLELPLAIGRGRARDRGKLNRLDSQEDGFYERAYPGYREYIGEKNHIIVDAARPLSDVVEPVLVAVRALCGV